MDEADIANIKIDQNADVFAVAYPDQALKGKVQSIATSAKRSSYRQGLSFTVKILLDTASDIDIRPGMSCRAEIFTEIKGDTIAVPIEAVVFEDIEQEASNTETDQDNSSVSISVTSATEVTSHVFVLIDGKSAKREVELGISNDRLQEIISGLKVGDKVITGPARVLSKLEDGQSVDEIEDKVS